MHGDHANECNHNEPAFAHIVISARDVSTGRRACQDQWNSSNVARRP